MIPRGKPITGKKALAIILTAFGVVICANATLAIFAVSTFPGLEVRNGFVSSQSFEFRRSAQQSLGWTAEAEYRDGRIRISIVADDGLPADVEQLAAMVRRPTHNRSDTIADLSFDGRYHTAFAELDEGIWNIDLSGLSRSGIRFQQRLTILVQG